MKSIITNYKIGFLFLKMSFLILLIELTIPLFLVAQEVQNEFNYVGKYTNTSRTDYKPDLNPVITVQKTEQQKKLEARIYEIRKSGNPDQSGIIELQKQIDAVTKQSVTMPAADYPGKITPADLARQFDAVNNSLVLNKSNMKGIATVTEFVGTTAGRIWVVAGFQVTGTSSNPDSLIVFYSSDNGLSWYPYANIALGGTDKINTGDIDAEIIDGGTNKFLHIVYGLRASGGTGKWFAAGASIQLTGTFNGNLWAFMWPGDDATKRYYCPRITSDIATWPTAPWVYVAVSFDSAGASGRVNTQKFAQMNSPATTTPYISYKADKIYWYSETATQQNLFTDIAFFSKNFIDSLIISYCGVSDSTKVYFSKMSASGSLISPSVPGQYIGPIGGSEPDFAKYGGRLSSNGNSNGSIFFIFRQNSATTTGIKYFRTTNFGDFNTINQSVIWTASSGVSFPDIVGVRNANTHRFGFIFHGVTDSLQYVSIDASGNYMSASAKMNSVNYISDSYAPAIGMRFVTDDSCFALYSESGSSNVWAAQGCSGTLTGISIAETPADFRLSQNFPNPFNPSTKISYSLPKQGFVTLKVYDILGKEVALLVNETKQAGNYIFDFNPSNLTSGVYFYKLESNGFSDIKKMVLLK